jgi:hypothetical protein
MERIKIKFIILVVSLSLFSCKKDRFKLSDVTETDIMGNLVGNVNQNDWKLYKLSQATDFDMKVFNQLNTGTPFNVNDYHSCDSIYNFNLIAYPNPIISNCMLNFKLTTNIEYVKALQIVVSKDGKLIEKSGVDPGFFPDYKINALVKRDFIYYAIFVTQDSCLYYTKGNVIGCTL